MKVRDLLGRPPVTVRPSTTLQDAAATMERQGVGTLLVTEDEQLLGLVTDRDMVLRGLARAVPADARIDALMTTQVSTLDADTDLLAGLRFFREHLVRRAVLTAEGRLVGLLSLDDVLVTVSRGLRDLLAPVEADQRAPHHEGGLPVRGTS
jgi:CBS domain-containing protein